MITLVFCFWFVQEDEIGASPVLAPKQKDAPKEEPADNSPLKPASSGPARGTPSTSKPAKGKRKMTSDDAKPATTGAPSKKGKTENVQSCDEPLKFMLRGSYFPDLTINEFCFYVTFPSFYN